MSDDILAQHYAEQLEHHPSEWDTPELDIPADLDAPVIPPVELTTDQKLDAVLEQNAMLVQYITVIGGQTQWLCEQVNGMLTAAMSMPGFAGFLARKGGKNNGG